LKAQKMSARYVSRLTYHFWSVLIHFEGKVEDNYWIVFFDNVYLFVDKMLKTDVFGRKTAKMI